MGSAGCKVILCICSAAQVMERGNALLAYRQSEGETVDEHQHIIDLIKNQVTGMYEVINQRTSLGLIPDLSSRRSMPVAMREGYEAVIAQDQLFDQEHLVLIIEHGNEMELLGRRWEKKLLTDAGWPPTNDGSSG